VITKIVMTSGPTRKKPQEGDEKVVKGVLMVRRRARVQSGPHKGAMLSNNGRPCYEWVVKEASRESMNAKRN
jgi:hypothetical protein